MKRPPGAEHICAVVLSAGKLHEWCGQLRKSTQGHLGRNQELQVCLIKRVDVAFAVEAAFHHQLDLRKPVCREIRE
ncbi:hypothetical protein ACIFSR_29665 [Paenibacillus sp. NRS-1760]